MVQKQRTARMFREEAMPRRIDLGAGKNPVDEEVLTVDVREHNDPDLVLDLTEETAWKNLPDDHFEEVYMYHVLEHLHPVGMVMRKLYEKCVDGALVQIRVPHYSRGGGMDHCNFFKPNFPTNFLYPDSQEYVGDVNYELLSSTLRWRAKGYFEDFHHVDMTVEHKVFNAIGKLLNKVSANNVMVPFLDRFCYMFGGFEEIEWRLKVKKVMTESDENC